MWPVVSGFWRLMAVDQRGILFCTENLLAIAWVASRLQWTAVVCMEDTQTKKSQGGFWCRILFVTDFTWRPLANQLVNMHFTAVTGGTVVTRGCQEVADWYLVCRLASYSRTGSLNWLFVQRVQVLIPWVFPQQTTQKPDGARDEEIRLALTTYLWLSILLPLTKYFSCIALQVKHDLSTTSVSSPLWSLFKKQKNRPHGSVKFKVKSNIWEPCKQWNVHTYVLCLLMFY